MVGAKFTEKYRLLPPNTHLFCDVHYENGNGWLIGKECEVKTFIENIPINTHEWKMIRIPINTHVFNLHTRVVAHYR
jgi:hypothetical protein